MLRQSDLDALTTYDWPGNVRELQNVMQRAVIGAQRGRLAVELLRTHDERPAETTPAPPRLLTDEELRRLERENLVAVLDQARWKIAGSGGAAEFLGLHPATLTSRLRALDIERPRTTER